MSTTKTISETLPSWDLSQFYASYNDPQMDQDLKNVTVEIQNFEQKYRGKVAGLSPIELLEAIKVDENISINLSKPSYYLMLAYDAGGEQVDQIQQAMISRSEQTTVLGNLMTFFGVELSKRTDLIELSKTSELQEYSYYLARLAQNAKYVLSEEVENVIALKDLSGSEAWSKLYTDLSTKIEVTSDFEGETKTYREEDLLNLSRHHDRKIRKTAWELLTTEFEKNEELALEAYNNILLDAKLDDNLRGFKYPQESSFVGNQVSQKVVESLITAVNNRTDLVRRYTKLKQEILGIEDLQVYDLGAEISFENLDQPVYSWEDAKNIILQAFGEFNPKFEEIAQKFFDNNWIDAANRKQKKGGAYMSSFAPGFHPNILTTFKSRFEDVLAVAHELGHGIHSFLTQEVQSLINSSYTLSTAEIASLCCETIVFDKLIATVTDPRLRLKLYCNKIEEEAGNIFTAGISYYGFESQIHDLYRQNGPITKEQIRELWLKNRYENIYQDLITPPTKSQYSWSMIHHFTYLFYNYVYASGVLVSSAIYDILKHDHSKVENYLEILRLGGSMSPVNLLKKLDLDIEQPEFWQIGLNLFESQINTAQEIWSEIKKNSPKMES
jgi:oligoendopeptidase F